MVTTKFLKLNSRTFQDIFLIIPGYYITNFQDNSRTINKNGQNSRIFQDLSVILKIAKMQETIGQKEVYFGKNLQSRINNKC